MLGFMLTGINYRRRWVDRTGCHSCRCNDPFGDEGADTMMGDSYSGLEFREHIQYLTAAHGLLNFDVSKSHTYADGK